MLKRFLRYYIPYKKILTLTLLGAVITSLAELFFPMYLRYIMNDILPRRDVSLLFAICVRAVCIVFVKLFAKLSCDDSWAYDRCLY